MVDNSTVQYVFFKLLSIYKKPCKICIENILKYISTIHQKCNLKTAFIRNT